MKSKLSTFALRITGGLFAFTLSGILLWAVLISYLPNYQVIGFTASVAALALTMTGQYLSAWKTGERDRNLVKYNHITYQPKRGFIAGGIAFIPAMAGLITLEVIAHRPIYIVYICVIALTPLIIGVAYLNGYNLNSLGISIMYRKKKRR